MVGREGEKGGRKGEKEGGGRKAGREGVGRLEPALSFCKHRTPQPFLAMQTYISLFTSGSSNLRPM